MCPVTGWHPNGSLSETGREPASELPATRDLARRFIVRPQAGCEIPGVHRPARAKHAQAGLDLRRAAHVTPIHVMYRANPVTRMPWRSVYVIDCAFFDFSMTCMIVPEQYKRMVMTVRFVSPSVVMGLDLWTPAVNVALREDRVARQAISPALRRRSASKDRSTNQFSCYQGR
jgi:hypothetical protein